MEEREKRQKRGSNQKFGSSWKNSSCHISQANECIENKYALFGTNYVPREYTLMDSSTPIVYYCVQNYSIQYTVFISLVLQMKLRFREVMSLALGHTAENGIQTQLCLAPRSYSLLYCEGYGRWGWKSVQVFTPEKEEGKGKKELVPILQRSKLRLGEGN